VNLKDVILAMNLGDGYMVDKKSTCIFAIEHCLAQKDYLMFKASILKSACGGKVSLYDRKTRPISRLEKGYISFREFYKIAYPNKKKSLVSILENISDSYRDMALALWLCDDGRIASQIRAPYHARLGICTHSESLEDQQKIVTLLKSIYNLDAMIKIEKKSAKSFAGLSQHYYLMFDKPNSKKIWEIIKPVVNQIPSMCHKFRYIAGTYDQEYNPSTSPLLPIREEEIV